MMENNQNKKPMENVEKKTPQNEGNSGNRQNRHRRFHKHRKHKNDNEKKQNSAGVSENAPSSGSPAESKKENTGASVKKNPQPQQSQKKNQPQNQNGEKGKDRPQKKGGKNRSRGKNNFRHGNEQRPYDPYEEVRPEELSLEELRARIVLNAAEPEKAVGAPLSEAPAPLTEEPAVIELLAQEPAKAEEEPVERTEVIGIRFRSSRKTYYFDPRGIQGKKGDFAVVETARGAEFGEISLANAMINSKDIVAPLRPVLRIATPEDILHDAENRQKEKEALTICQERVLAHKLEMKLIDVQYAFDNSKLLFYFTAEGRVDFRDLVKDLASYFRTRIELRQIGIRDEAKMLGGLGACGRTLCCSTFLPDFAQVSIKMAKDQNLSLNSAKISGLCGRLMCCLRYESEVYAEEIRLTPSNDSIVKTADGIGTVIGSTPLAGTVKVLLKDSPDTPPKQYHRSDVTVIGKGKRENNESKGENSEKSR